MPSHQHQQVTPGSADRIEIPCAPDPRVSVIIPSAAGSELLLGCLRSLSRHAPQGIPFETIVVINNATGEAVAEVAARLGGVTLLSTSINLGLAGAGNRGRSIARGELLIVLHDDAEIEAGWMEALVEAADRFPDAGAIGGKVLNPDGTLQTAGMILWSDGRSSPPWIAPSPSPAAFASRRAVDYCGTSSLLVRRATWDALGGLDEQFFPAYYVDVDLAMGVRSLQQFVLYEPASRIRHHRGSSTGVRFRSFITERNRQRFLEKWKSELTAHEPPDPGSVEAIARAMSRCEAARQLGRPRMEALRAPAGTALDTAAQERRHLMMERSLFRDFAAELATTLDAHERLTDHWRQTASALRRLIESDSGGERAFATKRVATAAALLGRAAAEEPTLAARNEEIEELRRRSARLKVIERIAPGWLYRHLLRVLRALRSVFPRRRND